MKGLCRLIARVTGENVLQVKTRADMFGSYGSRISVLDTVTATPVLNQEIT